MPLLLRVPVGSLLLAVGLLAAGMVSSRPSPPVEPIMVVFTPPPAVEHTPQTCLLNIETGPSGATVHWHD